MIFETSVMNSQNMPSIERTTLIHLRDAMPIPYTMQCLMHYAIGIARDQQFQLDEPLLAPLTYPERVRGTVTDTVS
jgi:hypothetical protein